VEAISRHRKLGLTEQQVAKVSAAVDARLSEFAFELVFHELRDIGHLLAPETRERLRKALTHTV